MKDCIWADNQKITDIEEEEKTRIEFTSTQWLKVKEWILAQGENAIPRSPQWFVDSWKNTVLEMNENLKPFYYVKKGNFVIFGFSISNIIISVFCFCRKLAKHLYFRK